MNSFCLALVIAVVVVQSLVITFLLYPKFIKFKEIEMQRHEDETNEKVANLIIKKYIK